MKILTQVVEVMSDFLAGSMTNLESLCNAAFLYVCLYVFILNFRYMATANRGGHKYQISFESVVIPIGNFNKSKSFFLQNYSLIYILV